MRKNSTLTYLVNIYDASSLADIEADLDNQFAELLTGDNTERLQPSEQTMATILDFASSYETEKTNSIGHVEMNLN